MVAVIKENKADGHEGKNGGGEQWGRGEGKKGMGRIKGKKGRGWPMCQLTYCRIAARASTPLRQLERHFAVAFYN